MAANQNTSISVAEAREFILRHFAPLPPEPTPLGEAGGRVLAAPVVSGLTIPPFANSAMDGYDVRAGETVLAAGTVLRPSEIGLLAALGVPVVPTHRRPRVAILATGDELVPVEAPLAPGQIHDSNSYAVAAQVAAWGGVPLVLG